MKLYFVAWKMYDSEQSNFDSQWVGSQAEAASLRKNVRQKHGYIPKSVGTKTINVPTDKRGLLKFLNEPSNF